MKRFIFQVQYVAIDIDDKSLPAMRMVTQFFVPAEDEEHAREIAEKFELEWEAHISCVIDIMSTYIRFIGVENEIDFE